MRDAISQLKVSISTITKGVSMSKIEVNARMKLNANVLHFGHSTNLADLKKGNESGYILMGLLWEKFTLTEYFVVTSKRT